jgi:hypothetical protein
MSRSLACQGADAGAASANGGPLYALGFQGAPVVVINQRHQRSVCAAVHLKTGESLPVPPIEESLPSVLINSK